MAITIVETLSTILPGFLPTQIPKGIPIRRVIAIESIPTSAETPNLCHTNELMSFVGNSENETPKSPLKIPAKYVQYLVASGSLNPYCASIALLPDSVCPAVRPDSPGMALTRKNVIVNTIHPITKNSKSILNVFTEYL